MRRCQVRREVFCETCCEMRLLLSAQRDSTTPVNILSLESHACASEGQSVFSHARRDRTEKNVRATRCSVFTHRVVSGEIGLSGFLTHRCLPLLDKERETNQDYFRLFRRLKKLSYSSRSPEKFLFCMDKIEPVEWQDLVPRQHIDDCFEIHNLH